MRTLSRGVLLASLALLALACAILVRGAFREGSPESLVERKGVMTAVETHPLESDPVSKREELRLQSSSGLDVHAVVRVPRGRPELRLPAAVLVGGINRGRRIAMARGIDPVARRAMVISFDYPLRLRPSAWRLANLLTTLPRIRQAAFDTVAATLLVLDYLGSRPDVDAQRIFLIGGSLGAEVVTVVGGVDSRPAAVVALYGGAPLGPLISHTLEHPSQRPPFSHWRAIVAGRGLAWLLTPLEPARYATGIAPRPFLMVNGIQDSLIPTANVYALADAAGRPKELIWVAGDHVQPEEADLLEKLSGIVTAWLARCGLLLATASSG